MHIFPRFFASDTNDSNEFLMPMKTLIFGVKAFWKKRKNGFNFDVTERFENFTVQYFGSV